MMRTRFVLMVSLLASGCSFKQSGAPLDTADGGASSDAASSDAATPLPCEEGDEVALAIAINGVTEPSAPGKPLAQVLVGDTVTVSVAGSCAMDESVELAWRFTPDEIEATVEPAASASMVTVYPGQVGTYTVELSLTSGQGPTQSIEVLGFEALGFVEMDSIQAGSTAEDARGLAIGGGYLWIAGRQGAYRKPLATPGASDYERLDDLFGGVPIADDLAEVAYDPLQDDVWFAHRDERPGLWQAAVALPAPSFTFYELPLGQSTVIHDIEFDALGTGVVGESGLYYAAHYEDFEQGLSGQIYSLFVDSMGTVWFGDEQLNDLLMERSYDQIFPNATRLEVIEEHGGALWIGSRDRGVARFELASRTVTHHYDQSNSELPNNRIKAMAIDAAGDVWVATDSGVGRFKQDRQVWVTLDSRHGLSEDNMRAVAIDETDGRRVIYAGTNHSMHYLAAP